MDGENPQKLRIVVESLARLHPISADGCAAIEALPFKPVYTDAHHFLVREGERPEYCGLLLEGYACRHKMSANGGRQIVSFHLPGDVLDAQHLELECADHNVQTITPATVALVYKRDMQALVDAQATIRKAIWRSSLIEASIFREWVLNVGRRTALGRVAHVICEFAARREAARLGSANEFELPMTQEHIADATGLTPVHVNRTMRTLDGLGVLNRKKRQVTIVDKDKLLRLAEFDPLYLHIAA